jgi:hypothetical protein
MNVRKHEEYTLDLDVAELTAVGAGYCQVYPASNMVWFHRQVVNNVIRREDVVAWLEAAAADCVYVDTLVGCAECLLEQLTDKVPPGAKVRITVVSEDTPTKES